MIPKASGADVGVIVGRFQVHRLHDAHDALIRSVYDSHAGTVIVLGLSPVKVSHRNPLDFEARKAMLLAAFPKATILYIKDQPDDHVWSAKLDALIDDIVQPAQAACLYGGRDSFITRYHGRFPTHALEPRLFVSASELRKSIAKRVMATEDFRAGVIWASANGYPKVFPTVDIAVYRVTDEGREWALVRKPGEGRWRWPGGFVQPTDANYEQAARRELSEETGLSIEAMHYLGSFRVDDWRYRGETDQILTTLFAASLTFGALRPADDVVEGRWARETDLTPDEIVAEHHPLLAAVRAWGGSR